MSNVFDDPLSAFANEPVKTAENVQKTHFGEDGAGLRSIDPSKLKIKPTEQSKPAAIALPVEKVDLVAQKTVGAAKGLGFGVDLWGDVPASSTKKADLLATVSAAEPLDSGVFHGGMPSSSSVPAKKINVNQDATGRVRVGVAVASDETQFNDLTMATRLLEREEDLDYETFGKTNYAQQIRQKVISMVESSSARGDLEVESADVFRKMDEELLRADSHESRPKVSSATAAVEAPQAINVDLSSLDINSYIASQEASSGGGLFD